jgi:hypothetical protein
MKRIIMSALLGITFSTYSFADFKVIGQLEKRCPMKAIVIKESGTKDLVLVIESSKVNELELFKKQAGLTYYRSTTKTSFPPTFEGTIMSPKMNRLSEIRIFYSGKTVDCYIDILKKM